MLQNNKKAQNSKFYKGCGCSTSSNLWVVNISPGNLVVAGCFNFNFFCVKEAGDGRLYFNG